MSLLQWCFWIAILLGIIFWLFTRTWNEFPQEDEWEIWLRGADRTSSMVCVCYCKIGVVIEIVDALNQGDMPMMSIYTFKRRIG